MLWWFNPSSSQVPASEIINIYEVAEIEQILRDYGDERFSREIAGAIGKARQKQAIVSTGQLVSVIESAVPEWYKHRKLHCATKTFQAPVSLTCMES